MQFSLLRKTNIPANCALNLDGIWFFLCSLELLKDHYLIGIYKNIHRITTFVNIMGSEPVSKVHLVETNFREIENYVNVEHSFRLNCENALSHRFATESIELIKSIQMMSEFQFNSHRFFYSILRANRHLNRNILFCKIFHACVKGKTRTVKLPTTWQRQQEKKIPSSERKNEKIKSNQIKALTICFAFGDWFCILLCFALCNSNH